MTVKKTVSIKNNICDHCAEIIPKNVSHYRVIPEREESCRKRLCETCNGEWEMSIYSSYMFDGISNDLDTNAKMNRDDK